MDTDKHSASEPQPIRRYRSRTIGTDKLRVLLVHLRKAMEEPGFQEGFEYLLDGFAVRLERRRR